MPTLDGLVLTCPLPRSIQPPGDMAPCLDLDGLDGDTIDEKVSDITTAQMPERKRYADWFQEFADAPVADTDEPIYRRSGR